MYTDDTVRPPRPASVGASGNGPVPPPDVGVAIGTAAGRSDTGLRDPGSGGETGRGTRTADIPNGTDLSSGRGTGSGADGDAAGDGAGGGSPERDLFAHRYLVIDTLKIGNGVGTYLALDHARGGRVVLKTFEVATVQPAARVRFEHETRVLGTLSGLGLGRLHDSGHTGEHLFLAQRFVAGSTLETVLRGGALPIRSALRVGIEIAGALEIAHGAEILHRDVKPANVVVDDLGGASETVTLIDFGFARSPWLDDTVRDDLVGTVRYLAPEAAGLLNSPVDERSDLYALGVVLFECVAGRPPFEGPGVGALLRQHLSAAAPDLRSVSDTDVPRAFAAAVQRLLRKDPAERYQSASALAADLRQILAAVDGGDPDPSVVIGRHDRRHSLTDPAFVGREAELASLRAVLDDLAGGRSGLVLLEADSGGGKSRLLDELADQAAEAGMTVLHGQGVALAGQRPFAMLHGVAGGLTEAVAASPSCRADLAARIGDSAASVVRALPALQPVFGDVLGDAVAEDAGPEEFGEQRSLAGLRHMLESLGTEQRPVLLVLDDCQWADTLTVRLLTDLFAAGGPAHLAVVAAFRADEVPAAHPLRALPARRTIRLGPLTPQAVKLLAESMAGPLPERAVDSVVRLGGGNPFMAAAVLRGLVESQALVAEAGGWVVDDSRLAEAQAGHRSAAFLVRRLELLDDTALQLLSVGAILGKQFDIATAERIAGAAHETGRGAAEVLRDARRRRLIWIADDGATATFFHDKIRESLLARLTDAQRRALHGRAADVLLASESAVVGGAASGPEDDLVFDLAYHLDAAGRPADALPRALAAAELARRRYALDVSAMHYRMAAGAAASLGSIDVDVRTRLAEGYGDVLMLQGSYAEAGRQFASARELVSGASGAARELVSGASGAARELVSGGASAGPARVAELDGKMGALAFKQGDIPTAREHLERALAGLGRRVPRGLALLVALMWELAVQTAHSLLPRLTTGRRDPVAGARAEADFLALPVYSRLAYVYWFGSGKIACAWSHLRGMNLAERYRPTRELGQAWSEHAPVMTMLPWYGRGIRYALRSLQVRRDLGDEWGQGQSLNFTSVANYAATRYDDAIVAGTEAVRLLGRTGDQWEVNTAQWNLVACYWRQGRLREAAELAADTERSALAIGDLTAAGVSLSLRARATGGEVTLEEITTLLARGAESGSEDAQTTAELHLAEALVHRRLGDPAEAVAAVDRGLQRIRSAGLRQEYIAPLFAFHAQLLRELAESTARLDPRLRSARLRAAGRSARRARRWAFSYRNNAPHALRESALTAALRGHVRRAHRLLARSTALATAQGAAHEAALSELAAAELPARPGVPAAQAQARLEAARAAVAGFAAEPSTSAVADVVAELSTSDRFATVLEVGRAIASATSHTALELAIRDSALRLLRGERCHLLSTAAINDDRLTTQSGEELAGISHTLLQQAVDEGRPVVALDTDAEHSNDSLVLSGIRSALAAPVRVGGEVVSCLYVTHRQLGELFGDTEVQLAEFVATLAGAAYEHLAGNESRFRSLAQNSSDVITLVDADRVISYQSASVHRVFGLPTTGLVGQPVDTWVHPDDRVAFADGVEAAAQEPNIRVECRLLHADGSYRDAETTVTNLLAEPTVAAIVLNTRDVTERRIAEAQLRDKHLELERLSRAKDVFLASMSHELRTPLNAIIGFTGTLLMRLPGPLNGDQEHQLRTVERSGKHLLAIINDMLDMAKIESGEITLRLEEITVNDLVTSVTGSLQPLAAAKGLDLTLVLPDHPVRLRTDSRALGQILINLVSNAVKFTEAGGVDVTLIDDPADPPRRIAVRDTGPGIAEADLLRIFDAFERGSGDAVRSHEGTGLGLHISRKLGDLLGTRVGVETEVGRGSTFAVVLDGVPAAAQEATP